MSVALETAARVSGSGAFTGIVAALHGEARCLGPISARIGAQQWHRGMCLRLSGVGPECATRAGRALLDAGAIALLSWGTCGALRPGLVPGDLVLPQWVRGEDGKRWSTDTAWCSRLTALLPADLQPASNGVLLSGGKIWTTPEQKAEGAALGVAVDMESAALAQLASEAGVPFLAVRVVIDAADQRLPDLALQTVDAIGRPRLGPFLRGVVRHPGQLRELPLLARDFKRAATTLQRIAANGSAALAFAERTRA